MEIKRIEWSDELSIGNTNIDYDHKKILEIYNDLINLIESGKSKKVFAEILSKMTDYALKHLKKEEDYMEELEYPELEEHKNLHKIYMHKVAKCNIELLYDNEPDPNKILTFLKNWWTDHILIEDRKYENFRKKINKNAFYGII